MRRAAACVLPRAAMAAQISFDRIALKTAEVQGLVAYLASLRGGAQ